MLRRLAPVSPRAPHALAVAAPRAIAPTPARLPLLRTPAFRIPIFRDARRLRAANLRSPTSR